MRLCEATSEGGSSTREEWGVAPILTLHRCMMPADGFAARPTSSAAVTTGPETALSCAFKRLPDACHLYATRCRARPLSTVPDICTGRAAEPEVHDE
ncbi:hypothetical protein V5799_012887 [Amblyomma americanum]|uniref:Uncharacterized protein n=1 Tax=Amblyomma americanum TaxID=6943 RepID=A0AAQ4E7K4_AMBAM